MSNILTYYLGLSRCFRAAWGISRSDGALCAPVWGAGMPQSFTERPGDIQESSLRQSVLTLSRNGGQANRVIVIGCSGVGAVGNKDND